MRLGLFKISYLVIVVLNFLWYFYFTQIELIFIFPLLYGILYLVYFKFFKSKDDEPFHTLGDLAGLLLGNLYLILYGQQVYREFRLFSIEVYLFYLVFMVQGYMVVTSIIYITRYLIDLKSKEIVGQYDKIDTFFSFIYVISIVFILIL